MFIRWFIVLALLCMGLMAHGRSFNYVAVYEESGACIEYSLKLKISQVTFDLSKYTNLKKAYTGFQSQLGNGYTTFENALKKCNNDVLTAFDNNTALFNKLGNIKDLGETELAERMVKVSKGEDFGALKFNNVLTKFINVSSVSIPKTVDLSGYISQSSDNLIDIVVHFKDGAYIALVEDAGKFVEKSLSTKDLAEIINALPANMSVRLLSCNDLASAKELSKLINNRTFYASDGWVDLFQDGTLASENAFKKLVNGVETETIAKYSSASDKAKVRLGDGVTDIGNRFFRSINEFKDAIEKGENVFYVGKHSDIIPRPTGLNGIAESHHGVNSVWMKEKYIDYGTGNNAPTVYMLKNPNHNATRSEFNKWAAEIRSKQGGITIDYTKVTEQDIIDLANRQFDVADVPQIVRDEYFKLWNKFKLTLTLK